MKRSSIPCMFLLGMGLIMLVAGGCKEQPEAPAPQKPAVVRKKIEAPQPAPAQAVRPDDQEVTPPLIAEVTPEEPAVEEEPPPEEEPAPLETVLGPEEAPEEPKTEVAYSYDPKGKIDPFQPVFVTQTQRQAIRVGKQRRERKLPLTPLQKLDVSQLKVVGIIISPTGNKALVEDPSGKGYVITKGTYVGSNFGRVSMILKDRVVVEEEVEDFFTGQMKLQPVELRLQKKLGEV